MHADLAALKFLAMVERDLGAGGLRPLAEYLAEFPDHAALVTAEYRRLTEPDATPRAATASTTDRLLGGRYRVLASLGRGGFGEVYLADDTTLDRKVAIKVLAGLRALNREWRERLVREATITGRIDDGGLCPVHDVGFEDGTPFLVMPWINGRSLDRLLADAAERASPPLAIPGDQAASRVPDALLLFLERLARTLHAAHQAGVVHRDVSPSNILLSLAGEVKLTGFGIAKAFGSPGLTRSGAVKGKVPYIAPEYARTGLADPRADLFSLGVTLYELLVGERPFRGRNDVEILERIIRGEHEGASDAVRVLGEAVCLDRVSTPRSALRSHQAGLSRDL